MTKVTCMGNCGESRIGSRYDFVVAISVRG